VALVLRVALPVALPVAVAVAVGEPVGVCVGEGAAEALRVREREAFLVHEWPEIRARMARLHLDPARLLGPLERA
jgi:GntR family transcriptional regulator